MDDLIKRRFMELKAGGLLPSPKGIALAVIELTSQPDASFQDITRMVQADPAISGRILRYANAARGGSLRHIVSLGQAITFLGMSRVRQIVLGFSLIDEYCSGPCPAFDYVGYWKSSLATGIAAQRLAAIAKAPADESYTCGLLSGVGRLGFATAFPAGYAEILGSGASGEALIAEERKRFGLEHAVLSGEMLEHWGLPTVFTRAVRAHEWPDKAGFKPGSRDHALCHTLSLASRIGQLLNLDDAQRWQLFPAVFSAAMPLEMAEEDVRALVKAVVDDWQSWAKDLKLPARIHPDLSDLLSETAIGIDEHIRSATEALPLRFVSLVRDTERAARLRNLLEGLGYQVISATNVAEYPFATQGTEQGAPQDVALIDVGEYGSDAVQALRARQAAKGSLLHLIALIPDQARSDASRLLQEGADDYLLHGFSEAALQLRVLNAQHRVSLEVMAHAGQEAALDFGKDLAGHGLQAPEVSRDPVTNLPDQQRGLELVAWKWELSRVNDAPVACLMLALDRFKQLKDQHGQASADQVLRQVAGVISHCCRSSDIVFRYGEAAFCIVCIGAAEAKARLLAERIAAAVDAQDYALPTGKLRVAMHVGVSVRSPVIDAPQALIAAAVMALAQSARE